MPGLNTSASISGPIYRCSAAAIYAGSAARRKKKPRYSECRKHATDRHEPQNATPRVCSETDVATYPRHHDSQPHPNGHFRCGPPKRWSSPPMSSSVVRTEGSTLYQSLIERWVTCPCGAEQVITYNRSAARSQRTGAVNGITQPTNHNGSAGVTDTHTRYIPPR